MAFPRLPITLFPRGREQTSVVVKFGGSVTSHEDGTLDEVYLHEFFDELQDDLESVAARFAFVIGGGALSRQWMAAAESPAEKNQFGIEATWHNADVLLAFLLRRGLPVQGEIPTTRNQLRDMVQTQPERSIVHGGLQVGRSTDADAIEAAQVFRERGGEAFIFLLSNVSHIFTSNPGTNQLARPIALSTARRLALSGVLIDNPAAFTPKMQVPLDPAAVRLLTSQDDSVATPLYFSGARAFDDIRHVLSSEQPESGTLLLSESQYLAATR